MCLHVRTPSPVLHPVSTLVSILVGLVLFGAACYLFDTSGQMDKVGGPAGSAMDQLELGPPTLNVPGVFLLAAALLLVVPDVAFLVKFRRSWRRRHNPVSSTISLDP